MRSEISIYVRGERRKVELTRYSFRKEERSSKLGSARIER
jgi:hypothetical protein